ncbi:MAG: hypothetical protein ACOCRX_06465 [Candidatus Woesearchaeota archaeon]
MNIHFHHIDHFLDEIWDMEETKKIAELIIKNPDLLNEFADFILNSTNMDKYNNRRVQLLITYNDSDNLNKILKLFKSSLEKLSNNDQSQKKNLDHLRGAILEILIYRIISDSFEKRNHNCRVKVSSHTIEYRGKKTIDIACYSEQENRAKFFECKVNPYWFNEKEFGYLNNLYNHTNEIISDLVVAGASFDYDIKIKNKFEKNDITNIIPFGRTKIEELIDNYYVA